MLSVSHLSVRRGNQWIIRDLSFRLEGGHRLFLQGEIGTGKSTLLQTLLGFIPAQQGEIRLFDTPCRTENDFQPFRGRVGFCFQNPDDQLFGPTVLDDVAFGPLNQGLTEPDAYAVALRQLEKLDMDYLRHRAVNVLSGGEKNFVALAGVLAMQPEILLLDEPTNGLDSKNTGKLTALLRGLKLPMLIASHDAAFTKQLADSVLWLQKPENGA
ncbi:cobalt ABC transporter ATP-binding protein [Actinobacillus succinogenes]|uniref:ABC transporter related n=1 Tax=Actinobacillus succinogenes (strain ATCC 55618 / DSM 22257 / CCUG 43843 / 130Z) TaxID=339671 RepID=A6VMG6_ACTSZ|nr:energy-coupling factor ABC transporter ATP-binding protein [Actinobacillus succinogenes]ABR74163.1 ABC transporter related [Actinobacillus succinogenes 130Z]PHI39406.1 cobalt ABC transporter ATP-binding protein [Actinobacillus succinogenes]